jgi:hypothetical protein
MYIVQSYTFAPGEPGIGTITISAILKLEDFGTVTNVTRNSVLYSPAEGNAGASVSYDGGDTILTLEQSTTYCDSSDKVQIIVLQGTGGGGEPATDVHVTNTALDPVNVQGSVTVTNDSGNPVPVEVGNWPASVEVSNDSGNPLPVTGLVTIGGFAPTATDAFGRQRVSQPFTMFDSSHRFADNGLWTSALTSGGTATFNSAQGLMDLAVTTANNSEVVRETTKVFPYQPGKSLQILSTFVFEPVKNNLRQRLGYYSTQNGFFLELDSTEESLCFVERSFVTGVVTEKKISQMGGVYGFNDTGWNTDKLDGEGPSGITLDISKAQILFMDIEWLGVGTVRLGFCINGQFIVCHQFQHANLITSTYITTASLPLRYEIKNTGTTDTASTLKQICSTVISEGGYTLVGSQQSVGTPITTAKALTVAGTYYPVVALRLKAARLDAIAIVSAVSLMGLGNNEKYCWRMLANTTVSGGTWTSASANSAVEYSLNSTAVSGGRVLASGFTSASNQGSPSIDILKEALFSLQLERDGLSGTPYVIALAIAGANASQSVYGSIDWEEVSR